MGQYHFVHSRNSVFRKYMTGYTLIILVDMSYIVSVISAQLSMASTPLFEPNLFRFILTAATSLILLLYFGDSFRIRKEHISMVVVIGICDYIYSTCYFISAVFMPVGNLEGVFVAMWILCSTFVDLVRQRIKCRAVISAVLGILGIFLMIQPWRHHNFVADITRRAPCETLTWTDQVANDSDSLYPQSNVSVFNILVTDQNHNTVNIINNHSISSIQSNLSLQNTSSKIIESIGPYLNIEMNPHAVAIGYILVAIAAMAATATGNMSQNLMTSYSVATITFWVSVFEAAVTGIAVFACSNFPGIGGWSMPDVTYCILFTVLYITFGAAMDLSTYYTYKFLPVSQVVILLSMTVMILYLCQRTFLFNDGNANVYELCGVVCTFLGAVLSPIMTLFQKRTEYEEIM